MAETPAGSWPFRRTAMVRGFIWGRVWVANTCSTSLVPMPKARAPKAPWVVVWLSPQKMVFPGRVIPSSGMQTWMTPWRASAISKSMMPCSRQLARRACSWVQAT